MTLTLAAIIALSGYGAWSLGQLRRSLLGTTLVGSWYWCLVAGGSLLCVAIAAAVAPESAWLPSLRWLVLVQSFSPFIARLGAKRPQDGAWHWVVLSFVVVFGLPAWKAILLHRELLPSGWLDTLVLTLLVLQVADTVATGLFLPATLLAAAQLLMHPVPRWWPTPLGLADVAMLLALALSVLAVSVAAREFRRRKRFVLGWSRTWVELRDRFGVLWSLRLLQRFNDDMQRLDLPVRLSWQGFEGTADGESVMLKELPPEAARVFENLARRFADPWWLVAQQGAGSAAST